MDDCCAVCAEPLEWTAYGPCGHKDACSKCVTRLRFALGDSRCVICQQQSPAVVVTRFMGTFTGTLPAEDFMQLKVSTLISSSAVKRKDVSFMCFDNKLHAESAELPHRTGQEQRRPIHVLGSGHSLL